MSSNLTISFELIFLMGWLLTHEKSKLKKLVKTAVDNGLAQELENLETQDQTKINEQLHATILDFLLFLEESLLENLENVEFDTDSKEKLTPALKKIDLANIDLKTIWLSLQQVKSHISKQEKKRSGSSSELSEVSMGDPKDMLYNLLIKNWNPEKKEPVN